MASEFLPSSEKFIRDSATAQLLVDPRARHHLAPFVGQARNVSEVAASLGTSTHALLYWVKKFLGHGLLELSRSEARPGRAIKYYQATHIGKSNSRKICCVSAKIPIRHFIPG